jgi:succinoglycan biosynthesis transport protein ExoP
MGAHFMELRRFAGMLRDWWWLVTGGTALGLLTTFLVTKTIAPVYIASAVLMINQTSTLGSLTYSDALLNQQLVHTYSQLAVKPIVLQQVASDMQLPFSDAKLDEMISAHAVPNTQLLEIDVEGNDPRQVTDIANKVAQVFILQQRPFLPPGQESAAIRIAQPALPPSSASSPRLAVNLVVSGLISILLTIGIVILAEYIDDTVKTPEDLERAASIVAFGAVVRVSKWNKNRSVLSDQHSISEPALEAFRLIRANLEFASVDHQVRSILVTSAVPGEGKSTVAANLAAMVAHGGKKVILIDADLRRPSIHHILSVASDRGLTNLLVLPDARVEDYLLPTPIDNLKVITSGSLPPNPAELLGSKRFRELLAELTERADLVVIDSPPAIALADAVILASRVDATVLVVDSKQTRTMTVRRAAENLTLSGTRLLGGILNKLSDSRDSYYYYRSHYSYSSVPSDVPKHVNGASPRTPDAAARSN